jgi:hypothetical protein
MITSPDNSKKIKLPNLLISDIGKLDQLLYLMKENETEFIDIYKVCKKKWGDNKLLYLFFAEYLKKNSFTIAKSNSIGDEYVWKQMVSPRGLALDSFIQEQIRQCKKTEKKLPEKILNKFAILRSISLNGLLITSNIVSLFCSSYFYSK